MATPARSPYAVHRFPAEIISHAIWLYFRFPLGLRMVEEMLAARGIIVSHETVRQWARKFGQALANHIRRRLPGAGDKWHLDEVVIMIAAVKHSHLAADEVDRALPVARQHVVGEAGEVHGWQPLARELAATPSNAAPPTSPASVLFLAEGLVAAAAALLAERREGRQ